MLVVATAFRAQCMAQMGRVCSAREISLLAVEVLEQATMHNNPGSR